MAKSTIKILDIPIKAISKNNFLEFIKSEVKNERIIQIATVNAEFLVEANRNQKFKQILQNTFNIADTVTILWSAYFLKKTKNWQNIWKILFYLPSLFLIFFNRTFFHEIPERLSGADIFWDLIKLANQNQWSVFLLGAGPSVAGRAAEIVQHKFPNLHITGLMGDDLPENLLLEKIRKTESRIIFVSYGAPKQEVWLKDNLVFLNKGVVGIGVGGTLDFVAGKISRAPQFMRLIGLEWLWRLFLEPRKRIGRIITAVFVFPYLILKEALKN